MDIKKTTFKKLICISIAVLVLLFYIVFFENGPSISQNPTTSSTAVVMEGDKQVINISVRGGYSPNKIEAKANIPTIIRMTTNNTFDCSTALVIPKLSVRKNLPTSGVSDIDVPVQASGSVIKGTCSMGMYSFQIIFN